MARIPWITDPHLNFLSREQQEAFLDQVNATEPDGVLVGGDIGEADTVVEFLRLMALWLDVPVYFVLGNHDYYRGAVEPVRANVGAVSADLENLVWLPDAGAVELGEETALVGHGGWADGRYGDYAASDVELTDFFLIEDLRGSDRAGRLAVMQHLARQAVDHMAEVLPAALKSRRKVIFLTHVPPLRESCWYEGRVSNDNYLPHFSCKAMGDLLLDLALAHPDNEITVLCGHTHGAGRFQAAENLLILTGGAEYGAPEIQQVFDVT